MKNEFIAQTDSMTEDSHQAKSLRTPSWQTAGRLSWLGQMIASGCWIASVFAYGISSAGDVMQLVAASAWMVANIAALCESTT